MHRHLGLNYGPACEFQEAFGSVSVGGRHPMERRLMFFRLSALYYVSPVFLSALINFIFPQVVGEKERPYGKLENQNIFLCNKKATAINSFFISLFLDPFAMQVTLTPPSLCMICQRE